MTERMISDDLAALGALDGRDLIELDRLDAFAAPRTTPVAPVAPPSLAVAFALAGVHVRRAGRLVGGVAMLAFAALVVAICWRDVAGFADDDVHWWAAPHFDLLFPTAALVAIGGYMAGRAVARQRFERVVGAAGDALAVARTLAGRRERASLALAIAGPSALVIALGKLALTVGIYGPQMDWLTVPRLAPTTTHFVIDTAVAIAMTSAAAVVLAKAIARGRLRRLFAIGATGFVLGVASLVIGTTYDLGRILNEFTGGGTSSHPLRIALTSAGSLAVLLVFAAIAAARHRADQRIIDARTI
jgi:hypothetical protein